MAVALDPNAVAPPLDAVFRVVGDRVAVDPARVGRRLDIAGIAATAAKSPGSPVQAHFVAVQPALTTATARAMRIAEPVAEFTTPLCLLPATRQERFTTRYRPEDTIVEASPPIASKAQPYAAPTLLVAALG